MNYKHYWPICLFWFRNQSSFDESKDLKRLIPVFNELKNIFAKWVNVDSQWLGDRLTLKSTVDLLHDFLEINEWKEAKIRFLDLKLKVQGEVKK